MPISHLFEDFNDAKDAPTAEPPAMPQEDLEDLRLAAFEKGYSAGWDDAIAAQTRDQARVTASLASSLDDLSFTYHEAVNQMILSVEPIFRGLVSKVLPDVADRAFAMQIVTHLQDLVRDQVSQPVTIAVPPGQGGPLHALLPETLAMPVRIFEDPTLEDGQADLRLGNVERELDTAALLNAFQEAIDAFFYQTAKDAENG